MKFKVVLVCLLISLFVSDIAVSKQKSIGSAEDVLIETTKLNIPLIMQHVEAKKDKKVFVAIHGELVTVSKDDEFFKKLEKHPFYKIKVPAASDFILEAASRWYHFVFEKKDDLKQLDETKLIKEIFSRYGQSGLHILAEGYGKQLIEKVLEEFNSQPNMHGALKETEIDFVGREVDLKPYKNLFSSSKI